MKASCSSLVALILFALCLTLPADETNEKSPYPGFRPESALDSAFIAEIKTATVAVYPTIIRTPTNTTFSADSQKQIVAFLNGRQITKAVSNDNPIDPGEIKGQGQFNWFENDMAVIGAEVQKQGLEEKYAVAMEVLFPPTRGDRQAVFGIHCIILDRQGGNAFSFLLNSHHQIFCDADMVANDLSEQSRAALIKKATAAGLEALDQQIKLETEKPGE